MKKSLLFAVPLLLLLSGCHGQTIYSDYREIDQIELIQVIGVDKSGAAVTATVSTGAGMEGGRPKILKSSAATLESALNNCQRYTEKKYIFFAHTAHIVIGEEAAGQDITAWLEYVERAVSLRMDTFIYVIKGGTAEAAVSGPATEEAGTAELLNSLHKDMAIFSDSHAYTCEEVATMLDKNGCGVIAALELEETEDVISGGSKTVLKIAGYAIVRDGRVVAFTDGSQAKGVTLLLNNAKMDIIDVPDGEGGSAAIKLTAAKVKYKTVWEDGEIGRIELSVSLEGNVEELQESINMFEASVIERLENEFCKAEEERIRSALALSAETGADFLQLERRVRNADPVKYARMKRKWPEVFKDLEIDLKVTAKLMRTYDTGSGGR